MNNNKRRNITRTKSNNDYKKIKEDNNNNYIIEEDELKENNDMINDNNNNNNNNNYFMNQFITQDQIQNELQEMKMNDFSKFTDFKIVFKHSASDSIVLYANYNNKMKVAMKLSFDLKKWYKNDLFVEIEILRQSKLILQRHTPSLILYIKDGIVQYNDFNDLLSPEVKTEFDRQYTMYTGNKNKNDNIYIVMMEYIQGMTLHTLLTKDTKIPLFSEQDLLAILIQIYWFLACAELVGLKHNDLHANNILIYKSLKIETFSFILDEVKYSIQSSYIVKIFDFDRATIYFPGVERTTSNDEQYCLRYGQCNGRIGNTDIAGFNLVFLSMLQLDVDLTIYDSIVERISDFIFVKCLNQDIYDKYEEYGVMWMKEAEKQNDLKNIQYMNNKSAKLILLLLLQEFHILPDDNNNKTYFTLPNAVYIKTAYPLKSMMLYNEENVEEKEVDWTHNLNNINKIQKIPDNFDKIINVSSTNYVDAWNIIFTEIWYTELDQQLFIWSKTSIQLYKLFGEKTGYYPLEEHFWIACIFLSCPMYYSLNKLAKYTLLSSRFKYKQQENAEYNVKQIFFWERIIWKVFNNQLPIILPILYNFNNSDNQTIIIQHLSNQSHISQHNKDICLTDITINKKNIHKWLLYFNNT